MKGLTHFISAIAAASFIEPVVRRCAVARSGIDGAEASFLLALAGLYGIMPDTLDFKFGKFLERADVEVFPDPANPDPHAMAAQMGSLMDEVFFSGKPKRIQFHVAQLANDRWMNYQIQFDETQRQVIIQFNDQVTTSQTPIPGTAPADPRGVYQLRHAALIPGSTRNTTVDIMSGPMYGFRKVKNALVVDFLPWHRTWSHSYVTGLLLAIPLYFLAVAAGWADAWMYPVIAWLGFATHVTEDLTGHLGGSLLWPLIKSRSKGLGWFHAANSDANFITSFLAVLLIIFNLDRLTQNIIPMNALLFFSVFFVLPILVYFLPRIMVPNKIVHSLIETQDKILVPDKLRKSIEEIDSEEAQ